MLSGCAGEYQPQISASSTRQELLGQMGIEYWLDRLQRQWGTPRKSLKIILITDSQASDDIMDKMPQLGTIRNMLAPEMDEALELYIQRPKHQWIQWRVIIVEGHIDIADAPDEFY